MEGYAATGDERDMISLLFKSVMMELSVTNEALILLMAISAPTSSFQIHTSNCKFNVNTIGLPPHDIMNTLHTITTFPFTLNYHCGPRDLELGLRNMCGILLTQSGAAVALLQSCVKFALCTNHKFLVHGNPGVACDNYSAAVHKAFISPNVLSRIKGDWKWLWINGGEQV